MYEIDARLAEREREGKPVMVSLIGCGQMGTDIIAQVGQMKGMELPVIVDLDKDIALKALETAGCKREYVVADSAGRRHPFQAGGGGKGGPQR